MTALAADRDTKRAGNTPVALKQRVQLGTDIVYAGGMVGRNSSGLCIAGGASGTQRILGVAMETVDNSAGDSGIYANIERGAFWFANSASTDEILDDDIGEKCFCVDDATVAKTVGAAGARVVAGRVLDVSATYGVLVEILGDEEGVIASGTFTPVATTGTNTTAAGTLVGWYVRIGNLVSFTIRGSVTHTAGAPTASTVEFDPPVASAFDAAGDAGGCVTGANVTVGNITANTTNDRLVFNYTIGATGAQAVTGTGHYLVK